MRIILIAMAVILAGLYASVRLYRHYIYHAPVRILIPTFPGNGDAENPATWLENCGFEPVLITEEDPYDVNAYDGLLVPGGHIDIDAELYGRKNEGYHLEVIRSYDDFEIKLIREFAEKGKPVLGICRGMQLINVAFGGTLEQDIPEGHDGYRTVNIDPSCWLYEELGDSALVHHVHHQCIDQAGEVLVADQWDANDGRIEGIHHESKPILGVQWHPESTVNLADRVGLVFLQICKENRQEHFFHLL